MRSAQKLAEDYIAVWNARQRVLENRATVGHRTCALAAGERLESYVHACP
jgi:hypothetical protein